MLKNLIKITFRNFVKNKLYTSINLLGLTLGITCSIIIYMIISFESSYDNFHENKENTYRVVTKETEYGKVIHTSAVPYLLPSTLKSEFSELQSVAIVDNNFGEPLIAIKEGESFAKKFQEEDKYVTFTNNDYFQIFDYKWIRGDKNTALSKPYTAVISESLAKKYFGDEEPIGKIFSFDYEYELTITGVVEDQPENTELPFKLMIAIDGLNPTRLFENWGSRSSTVQCYLILPTNFDAGQFEKKLEGFSNKYLPQKENVKKELSLQKLADIHFNDQYYNFSLSSISNESLISMAIIGIFLLLTAAINFINLNTAVAVNRSKEVGLRKVMGSSKSRLVTQFLGETALLTLFSILLSLVILEAALPYVEYLTGYKVNSSIWSNLELILFIFSVFVLLTFLAGLYPAFYLSRFSPVDAIRNKFNIKSKGKLSLRNSLVVFQFVVSQFLIISTVVIYKQMDFFVNTDMGIEKESMIQISIPSNEPNELELLSNKLLSSPLIENISYSSTGASSSNKWSGGFEFMEDDEIIEGNTQIKFADENFIETYGLELLAGEGIIKSDTANRMVVNESFAKELGYNNYPDIIGKYVRIWRRKAPITGVIKDFNTSSLHEKIEPLLLLAGSNRLYVAAVKLSNAKIMESIDMIKSSWESVYPDFIFEFEFLDDRIAAFYEGEMKTSRLMNLFSLIAIIIGCIGLFGLSSFAALKRKKEIGVRKVLGATITDIVNLLSKDFAKLILWGFVIASPIAYLAMSKWLEDFAYKIELHPLFFLAGFLITALLALLTVSIQVIKAATNNPANSLKYE